MLPKTFYQTLYPPQHTKKNLKKDDNLENEDNPKRQSQPKKLRTTLKNEEGFQKKSRLPKILDLKNLRL